MATAVLSMTSNPSALDHYAISVISGIISILTHEAADDTQVHLSVSQYQLFLNNIQAGL